MGKISLQSQDGKVFEVDIEVAKVSDMVKGMLENLGDDGGDDSKPVPLSNVQGHILEKIIEYMEHHKDDAPLPMDEESVRERRTDDIDEWDKKLLDVDQGTLYDIIQASNYLDVKGLMDAGCKKIAFQMRGKDYKQMREFFNIENDFTAEEEERIINENKWAYEN
ncbi:S-phase kinase-associated protein 1 [Halotydeus destructor]|nr:S-phase kinase-associated protein 1 [Halotydeus destructor]